MKSLLTVNMRQLVVTKVLNFQLLFFLSLDLFIFGVCVCSLYHTILGLNIVFSLSVLRRRLGLCQHCFFFALSRSLFGFDLKKNPDADGIKYHIIFIEMDISNHIFTCQLYIACIHCIFVYEMMQQ